MHITAAFFVPDMLELTKQFPLMMAHGTGLSDSKFPFTRARCKSLTGARERVEKGARYLLSAVT